MSAIVLRHPGMLDRKNAENRAKWARKYFGGVHCPDLRNVELYRMGEWIALQVHWLRQGYRLLDRPEPSDKPRASRAKLFFDRQRKAR